MLSAVLPFPSVRFHLPVLLAAASMGCVVHGYPCKDGTDGHSGGGGGASVEDTTDEGSLLDGDTGSLLDDEGEEGALVMDGWFDPGEDALTTEPGPMVQPLPDFELSPAEVVQGEATVASLLADDVDWDHRDIIAVSFGEGVVLCGLEVAADGAEVSFGAWGDAALGPVDMTLTIDGIGEVLWEDAVRVAPPGGIVTPDPTVNPCSTLD